MLHGRPWLSACAWPRQPPYAEGATRCCQPRVHAELVFFCICTHFRLEGLGAVVDMTSATCLGIAGSVWRHMGAIYSVWPYRRLMLASLHASEAARRSTSQAWFLQAHVVWTARCAGCRCGRCLSADHPSETMMHVYHQVFGILGTSNIRPSPQCQARELCSRDPENLLGHASLSAALKVWSKTGHRSSMFSQMRKALPEICSVERFLAAASLGQIQSRHVACGGADVRKLTQSQLLRLGAPARAARGRSFRRASSGFVAFFRGHHMKRHGEGQRRSA